MAKTLSSVSESSFKLVNPASPSSSFTSIRLSSSTPPYVDIRESAGSKADSHDLEHLGGLPLRRTDKSKGLSTTIETPAASEYRLNSSTIPRSESIVGLPAAYTYPRATLLGLPSELRNQVYHEVFSASSTHKAPYKGSQNLRFLLTCRRVYHEANLIAFRSTTFVTQRWPVDESPLNILSERHIEAIQSIELSAPNYSGMVDLVHEFSNTELYRLSGLKEVIVPHLKFIDTGIFHNIDKLFLRLAFLERIVILLSQGAGRRYAESLLVWLSDYITTEQREVLGYKDLTLAPVWSLSELKEFGTQVDKVQGRRTRDRWEVTGWSFDILRQSPERKVVVESREEIASLSRAKPKASVQRGVSMHEVSYNPPTRRKRKRGTLY